MRDRRQLVRVERGAIIGPLLLIVRGGARVRVVVHAVGVRHGGRRGERRVVVRVERSLLLLVVRLGLSLRMDEWVSRVGGRGAERDASEALGREREPGVRGVVRAVDGARVSGLGVLDRDGVEDVLAQVADDGEFLAQLRERAELAKLARAQCEEMADT